MKAGNASLNAKWVIRIAVQARQPARSTVWIRSPMARIAVHAVTNARPEQLAVRARVQRPVLPANWFAVPAV